MSSEWCDCNTAVPSSNSSSSNRRRSKTCHSCKKKFSSVPRLRLHVSSKMHKENVARQSASASASASASEHCSSALAPVAAPAAAAAAAMADLKLSPDEPSRKIPRRGSVQEESKHKESSEFQASPSPSAMSPPPSKANHSSPIENASILISVRDKPPPTSPDATRKLDSKALGNPADMELVSPSVAMAMPLKTPDRTHSLTNSPFQALTMQQDFFVVFPKPSWQCYKCKIATFSSFIEASTHEQACNDANNFPDLVPSTAAAHAHAHAHQPHTHTDNCCVDVDEPQQPITEQQPSPARAIVPKATVAKAKLSTPQDKDILSPLHCFVRNNLELFRLSNKEAKYLTKFKQFKHVVPGQVGIRCIHCTDLNQLTQSEDIPKKGIRFPSSITDIYQTARTYTYAHFTECNLPKNVKQEYLKVRSKKYFHHKDKVKDHYVATAKKLGLHDSPQGYIHFQPENNANKTHLATKLTSSPKRPTPPQAQAHAHAHPHKPKPKPSKSHQVTKIARTTQKVLAKADSEPSQLVSLKDKSSTTDFHYLLLRQLDICHLSEADQTMNRKDINLGTPGFICKNCMERKWFCKNSRYLSTHTLSTINKHVSSECKKSPEEIKDALSHLKTQIQRQKKERSQKASVKTFCTKVWKRLAVSQKRQRPAISNGPSPKTARRERLFDDSEMGSSSGYETDDAEEFDESTDWSSRDGSASDSDYLGWSEDENELLIANKTSEKLKITGQTKPATEPKADPERYSFARTEDGWMCRNCSQVPAQFRPDGYECRGEDSPTQSFMVRHCNICQGTNIIVSKLIQAVLGMSRSVSGMRIDTLIHPKFKSIVKALVGDNEQLLSLFTDRLRAASLGEEPIDSNLISSIQTQYPVSAKNEDAVQALADFARAGIQGIWFDFVENPYFAEFARLVSPGYDLPDCKQLIGHW